MSGPRFVRIQECDARYAEFRVRIKSVDAILRESAAETPANETNEHRAARLLTESLVRRRIVAPLSTTDGKAHMWVKVLGVYVEGGTDDGNVDDECEALVATPNPEEVSAFGGVMVGVQ